MKLRAVLAGDESAGAQVLKLLTESAGVTTLAVMNDAVERGRGCSLTRLAAEHGIECWPAKRVKDPAFSKVLRENSVDILLNVHSLHIVCPEVIAATRIGAFNLHPGILPDYAGLNTVSWAIYLGESRFGVTLHWMDAGVDTGDIAYQGEVPIGVSDTPLSLLLRCVRMGVPLVTELLRAALQGKDAIPRCPQQTSRRTYFGKGVPHNGRVRWSMPARVIANFVRACDYAPFPSPWGHPRTALDGMDMGLLKTTRTYQPCTEPPGTIGPQAGYEVWVASSDEWVGVRTIEVEGAVRDASAVLRTGDCFRN